MSSGIKDRPCRLILATLVAALFAANLFAQENDGRSADHAMKTGLGMYDFCSFDPGQAAVLSPEDFAVRRQLYAFCLGRIEGFVAGHRQAESGWFCVSDDYPTSSIAGDYLILLRSAPEFMGALWQEGLLHTLQATSPCE